MRQREGKGGRKGRGARRAYARSVNLGKVQSLKGVMPLLRCHHVHIQFYSDGKLFPT